METLCVNGCCQRSYLCASTCVTQHVSMPESQKINLNYGFRQADGLHVGVCV